ncbi:MAG: ABC transporter ATP-binding protein [Bacteroidales bacterium]|nr:ABC transporter ATP-binding protein [Bacteroidales bacterium]
MISFQTLTTGYFKRSQPVAVSCGISASAEKGELIALIGLNGTGKSTLLRTLAALQTPLVGEILLENKKLRYFTSESLSRTIAFVSSSRARSPAVKVREMVELGRYPYTNWVGSLTSDDKSKVLEALTSVNTLHLAGQPLDQISDGEFQRVHIARALCQDTPVILLDEPTAFLDVINRYEIVVLLRDLCRLKNKTILFSTHDWSAALQLADRIWYLHEGTLTEGAPEDILMTGQLDAHFDGKDFYVNPETGQIRFTEHPMYQVALDPEAASNAWLMKAMKRAGIVHNPGAELSVAFHGNQWELTYGSNCSRHQSILDLINAVRKTSLIASPSVNT